MILADLGADVLRVDRTAGGGLVGPSTNFETELLNRGRRSVGVDLKHPDGPDVVLSLVENADALIEGFRPGVAERLGIGPEACLQRNGQLIYGRMTGYGQSGPLAQTVGHDLNYVAQAGVLGLIGREGQPPAPPLSLVGDFGGGGMLLALGILAALLERTESGQGQVIDAAMVEGAALLATVFLGYQQTGHWTPQRGTNLVDSGAPFYDSFETADGRWLSVAALEERFYDGLLEVLGLDRATLPDRDEVDNWPELRRIFEETIAARTRDEWCTRAEGIEACVAPVLAFDELESDPHFQARGSFVRHGTLLQPAPAPRFSRTPAHLSRLPPMPGEHTEEALSDWGFEPDRIAALHRAGAVGAPTEVPS
jgi:alpha-methylacyl-CoA racemase